VKPADVQRLQAEVFDGLLGQDVRLEECFRSFLRTSMYFEGKYYFRHLFKKLWSYR